jgi:hypothetical protein
MDQPQDQLQDGGLARAADPQNGAVHPPLQFQVKVAQDRPATNRVADFFHSYAVFFSMHGSKFHHRFNHIWLT